MLDSQDMSLMHLLRIQFLLLFSLLQCVAPLAHAHVNGDSADQKVHLAAIESSWLNSQDPVSSEVQLPAGHDHSGVVSMPPEYRYGDLALIHISDASVKPVLALRGYIALFFVVLPRQSIVCLPYQLPCSQAPPVKIVPVKNVQDA